MLNIQTTPSCFKIYDSATCNYSWESSLRSEAAIDENDPGLNMWKQAQALFAEEEYDDSQENLLEEAEGLCSLSPTQRLYGFGACCLAGLVCMFLSTIVVAIPIKFAVLFTFGNLLAIGSTVFLMGATRQLQMMFDPVRIYATSIYIGFVILALICALGIHSKLLTILAILCEICALIWYSLSYIPFARAAVSKMTIRLFDTEI